MKLKKLSALSVALLLSTSLLTSCGSVPRERFYVLSAAIDAQAADTAQQTSATYTIVIGPVTIPDVVDRPQIVTRMPDNQVTVAEQSRWAEPLSSGIARVVADNLTRLLAGARVSSFPQSGTVAADYRVLVDVQHFDATLGESSTDEFLWTVRATNKEGVTKSGRTVARETVNGNDYAALVAAHNRALTTLSHDIAVAMQTLAAVH